MCERHKQCEWSKQGQARARLIPLLREGKLSTTDMAREVTTTRFGVQLVQTQAQKRGCLAYVGDAPPTGLIILRPLKDPPRAPATAPRQPVRILPAGAVPITATWFGTYRAPTGVVLATPAKDEEAKPPRARPSAADAWRRAGNPMEGA